MKTQNKKLRFMSLLAVALVLSLSGCGKEPTNQVTDINGGTQSDSTSSEEPTVPFEGDSISGCVIEYERCSDEVIGYLLQITHPEGVGDTLKLANGTYPNAVKTYSEAEHFLSIGEEIRGIYRIMPDSLTYRACTAQYQKYNLTELEIIFDN